MPVTVRVDADVRDVLAAQWRENGRTEHASVAAFAHLSLDHGGEAGKVVFQDVVLGPCLGERGAYNGQMRF